MKRKNENLNDTLIRILAAQDGLLLPLRRWDSQRHGVICEKRWRYFTGGLPWRSGGRDGGERKAGELALKDLEAAGLVQIFRGVAKALGVKLTPDGDARARNLAGLPGMAEALALLDEWPILAAELGTMEHCGGEWLPESLFVRADWDGSREQSDRCWDVELFALPLIVRGLADGRGDTGGRAYYRPTPAGRELAAQRVADGAAVTVFPKGRAWDLDGISQDYLRQRQKAHDDLFRGEERSRQLGEMRLPACGWTAEFAAKYHAKMKAFMEVKR